MNRKLNWRQSWPLHANYFMTFVAKVFDSFLAGWTCWALLNVFQNLIVCYFQLIKRTFYRLIQCSLFVVFCSRLLVSLVAFWHTLYTFLAHWVDEIKGKEKIPIGFVTPLTFMRAETFIISLNLSTCWRGLQTVTESKLVDKLYLIWHVSTSVN